MFINPESLQTISWRGFERAVMRLLLHEGFEGVRLVGRTGDEGADLIAHRNGKRWLFQVKRWRQAVGLSVVERTQQALSVYRAQIPVIVSLGGFDSEVRIQQQILMSHGIPLQVWDRQTLLDRIKRAPQGIRRSHTPRPYQEDAIRAIVRAYSDGQDRRALVIMATGLGKTYTAAESVRRLMAMAPLRVLSVVHSNELVYQLERAFWPFLNASTETIVWNEHERPSMSDLERSPFTFGCLNSVAAHVQQGGHLPHFDVVLIDECHHVGAMMYKRILEETNAGTANGPFLLGLTATPWRPDEEDLTSYFGEPLVCVDIVTGLNNGFLTNVDYRMYTDNINWNALAELKGPRFTPKAINRTLFISEWDDAVVFALKKVWSEQRRPRAIVFCGTVDHATIMRDRINAMGFCNASAIYSRTAGGRVMEPPERNRILSDFHDGAIDVVCAVDIFNEGVDIPDVNIIVFQRVTHSRRIFVQQLGRGLRVAEGKDKVIVLDFVSDIRRFAAGIDLKDRLGDEGHGPAPGSPIRLRLQSKVTFKRIGEDDPGTETFLREWLEDVAAIESAGEDVSVLKFPPEWKGRGR